MEASYNKCVKSFFNLPKCDVLLNNYVCKFNQRRLTCVNGAVRHLYHLLVDLENIHTQHKPPVTTY